MSHRAAFTRAALSCVALAAASLALLTLPACNECDSSIDPVKCTDLCTQDPPHRDCAQCNGDSIASNCPQCQEDPKDPRCLDGSGGNAGTVSGSGGTTGGAGASGGAGGNSGSGGEAGVVSGNGGSGGSGGAGGAGSGGEDAGPLPVDCMENDDCDYRLPLCDGDGKCTACATDAVCMETEETRRLCDTAGLMGDAGSCVQCRADADCNPESSRPHCVAGLCEECETHADCSGDLTKPQCSEAHVCEKCTGDTNACTVHGARSICDTRAADTAATAGQCVECLTDSDCPNERPQCDDNGMCGPCNAAGGALACSGRMDGDIATPFCNTVAGRPTTGLCVQCVGDSATEPPATTCNDGAALYSCNLNLGRCTTTEVHDLQPCQECVADTECDDSLGLRCVEYAIEGVSPTKSYCFYDEAEQGNDVDTECPVGLKPFLVEAELQSVDGHAATYCMIATSSCEAYRDALIQKSCNGDDTMCGLGDPEVDGAVCIGTSPSRCTYSCDTDDECPATQPDCYNSNYCRP